MPKKAKPPLTPMQRHTLGNVFHYIPRWRAAEYLGVHESQISRWLAGKSAPADIADVVIQLDAALATYNRLGKSALRWFRDTLDEDDTTPPAA